MDVVTVPLEIAQGPSWACQGLEVPQDAVFCALLRRGPLWSGLDGSTYYKVYDAVGPDDKSLVFAMNVLDASKLEDKYSAFVGSGLLGWYKIVKGRVVLQEAIENIDHVSTVKKWLTHPSSAKVIRNRYEILFNRVC